MHLFSTRILGGLRVFSPEFARRKNGICERPFKETSNILSIETVKQNKTKEKDENGNVIHRGIAKRYFKKSFSVADNCEVKGAELKDGLLTVSLERIIQEKYEIINY